MNTEIRSYDPADCCALARLFYDTVHTVNAADYTPEQLDASTAKTFTTHASITARPFLSGVDTPL